MSPEAFEPTADELAIYAYWREHSGAQPRSAIVREKHLRRIRARLKEGYSVSELEQAVDVACWDQFYLEHGYHKQPDVIFRNAGRVDRLLTVREHEARRPIPL